ncbi:hypothetical protein P153DRAFT_6819 [Dothidotthia symphoricarpi CBS 119687]|uniref:Uncharacterized protein n=1 Tax=Dothidotthia symphoricarpi CBS 119687 TaxID=1392245 RepID=A0A6A6AUK2_9PLEO|nr:uncharacterized protein P153DRAFT_6819 [Dothidotthia symphoricarpi CBS 119687]KAF2134645.1 hypothetical protein P153DRAFT_6819 [Dothidotthia symphoricarpi CBS 119687]
MQPRFPIHTCCSYCTTIISAATCDVLCFPHAAQQPSRFDVEDYASGQHTDTRTRTLATGAYDPKKTKPPTIDTPIIIIIIIVRAFHSPHVSWSPLNRISIGGPLHSRPANRAC